MGRQSQSAEAGSGGVELKLDPAVLPQSFVTPDDGAEGGVRSVMLERTRVLLTRRLRGMAMKIAVPIAAYRGVVVRVLGQGGPAPLEVALVHDDRDLDVPLYRADDDGEVVSEWHRWSGALGLPLLFERVDGSLVTLDRRLGEVRAGRPLPRRPRVSRERLRPRFLRRRRVGRPRPEQRPPAAAR
ncbi:MAG TPA: DUF6101 family protein [Hyphomicrobiales bacterium]|nr:DUF6101 family protein [Hyphomicrobiales bacterium]